MPTNYWIGGAEETAQVVDVEITAADAATTYTLSLGTVSVSITGQGTSSLIRAALVAAWNASTHPYFTPITASEVGTPTRVRLTADTPGLEFGPVVPSVSGGSGTLGAATTVTSNGGPNSYNSADNWSLNRTPLAADGVVLDLNSHNILWGLDQSAVSLASFDQRQTYLGKVGLERDEFVTSVDGDTVDTSVPEYRQRYLKIGLAASAICAIGKHYLPGTPIGSRRTLIDTGTSSCKIVVHNTAFQGSSLGRPAVRLLTNHASAEVHVLNAPGGVGIAMDAPGETSTLAKVFVGAPATAANVYVGDGVTLTTWEQYGGDNVYDASMDGTTTTVHGGALRLAGETAQMATLNCYGGVTVATLRRTTGAALVTVNVDNDAHLDLTGLTTPLTITTLNWLSPDATIDVDWDVVTATTMNYPPGLLRLRAR